MRYRLSIIFLISLVLISVILIPSVNSKNTEQKYSFQYKYGIEEQELFVSIPNSLYDYYKSLDRSVYEDNDYASFVTPEAFISLADQIRTYIGPKTRSDEQFANAVLTLIHQIKYGVNETKYPIETIVESAGKCDTLSFLAASIMKAGGLDVVLLYFKGVHHMTIGVYLPHEPFGTWWWQQPVGYLFEGRKYWIAECTPAMDWKVGDIPPLLEGEIPLIIPLPENDRFSPGQISSKIGQPLNSSLISIHLSDFPANISSNSRTIRISGSIYPILSNETMVLYTSRDGISFQTMETKTDQFGNYSIYWNSTDTGTYYLRTSWFGNSDFAGSDSELVTVFLGFHNTIIQFESPDYYYLYGHPGASSFVLNNRKGLENFLNIQLNGSGVVLSGELLIFSSGHLITIPKDSSSISASEILITQGMQPLRLPNDIEKKTNDQFAIIINNQYENYTLNLKALDDYDFSPNGKYTKSNSVIINASSLIQEGSWYFFEAQISDNNIAIRIMDEFGSPLEIFDEIKINESDQIELLMLLTNEINKAVAFKDLKFEPIYDHPQENLSQNVLNFQTSMVFLVLLLLIITFFIFLLLKSKK